MKWTGEKMPQNNQVKNKFEYEDPETSEKYGVFERSGSFFMYLDNTDNFVKIPKEIYRFIKVSLYGEERIDRVVGANDLNRARAYGKTIRENCDTNCHRAMFYPQKNNLREFKDDPQEWSGNKQNKLFVPEEIEFFFDKEDFELFIKSVLGDEKFGVAQAYWAKRGSTEESRKFYSILEHSFYVAVSNSGDIIVFEKVDYGKRFRIVNLEDNFNDLYNKSYKTYYGVMPYSEFQRRIIEDSFNPFEP